jgi:ppGpp synthetase/RelA/SpoT-type nucleotidyltranferase
MTGPATTDLRAWLEGQVKQYAEKYPRYQAYAKALDEVLKLTARRIAPLAIVQVRPKSIASFAEKALRKRDTHPDPVHQFTDLCGGRVIARTRREVDELGRFVVDHFAIDWENSVDTSERLRPTEFGYRSVHYIVSFRRDIDYGAPVPEEVFGLKAEVQLRTVAEHAYSDFAHDLTYKGAFPLPLAWQRELAGVAATLEEVDGVFARVEEGLREYATSYGAYLTEEQMRAQIDRLQIVLEHDPANAGLAVRAGTLALALGDWQRAIDILSPLLHDDEAATPQPVLRTLGVAVCKLHRDQPTGADYRRGQRYLEVASAPEHADVDAVCSYASTWKGLDDARARDLYRRAFELDPAHPYALGNYLDLELERDPRLLESLRPVLRAGVERCRHHIAVGINLPWAHYDLGRFHLLLGEAYESLDAYTAAIRTSSAEFMLDSSLQSLERLSGVVSDAPGLKWARLLLTLALAARFPSPEALARVQALASPDPAALQPPVVIVAGGTHAAIEEQMRGYAELLESAFEDFEGTILSGGTTQGISGIVGDIGRAAGDRIRTVGYLPQLIPADATADPDYDELRHTDGHGFSPLEPLQNWLDLIASGVSPASVRVLGINGGLIAAAEFRIALALGASVGLVADSGREAGKLLANEEWASSPLLLRLPADPETLRAFLAPITSPIPEPTREQVAKASHGRYVANRLQDGAASDLALAAWQDLRDDLRTSNLEAADHIAYKLRRIGCVIVPADAPGEPAALTPADVELMAEIEHGRWNVERLRAGWRWAEQRDPSRQQSPYLVAWPDVPDEVREYDREAVRAIPDLLAEVGLSIRRERRS